MFLRCSYFLAKSEADVLINSVLTKRKACIHNHACKYMVIVHFDYPFLFKSHHHVYVNSMSFLGLISKIGKLISTAPILIKSDSQSANQNRGNGQSESENAASQAPTAWEVG